mgnify:CR=1 FL=1
MTNGKGIAKISFDLNIDRETVIPPFSSKVSRSIVIKLLGGDNRIFTYSKYKPYICSPIFYNGRPLIRYYDGRFKPDNEQYDNILKLYPSKDYKFTLTTLDTNIISFLLASEMNDIELFNSRLTITSMKFTITTWSNLLFEENEFIMRLVTPALLQLPKKWGNMKRDGNVLFPLPSLLLWSVIQHWNLYAPNDLKIDGCKRLAVYSNFSMVEMDYNLRPVTIVYNNLSRPKGIKGWIRWNIKSYDKTLDMQLRRILAYAQYIGVGRSRSIGFGMIDIIKKSTDEYCSKDSNNNDNSC